MSQINVGVTGWGDHRILYEGISSPSKKLEAYAGHFPVVELDSSFYAVPPEKNITKWINETPPSFQFVVKAYQGMTGHQRGENPFKTQEEMFKAFNDAIRPFKEAGKLAMVLCQFPPWYDCQRKYVDYIKYVREQLREFDAALEFRHQSWYSDDYKERTLEYLKEDDWIHSICDEPQAGERSIPFVPVTTHDEKAFVRFHGRNTAGWNKPVKGEGWREVRYLYDYSEDELKELEEKVKRISQKVNKTYVVFNNNSGGHAAGNAKTFISDLGITYEGLAPRQMNLFDE
ncbi:DUF72 domain-containing protein [Salipaludibacillus aurantiacus]|uniref:Uncharacterized conserved protein YecE, DUF72 family n=1 Tax=Salipaludibacillus aurantiacus TaxID=1601833 RepID=A0A1H9WWU7_9BACI|nr:DUF72 domain-containing protein [Salipaludibacillus aurantiacus]SES37883.1 Uncharacterized conserved protein YecE, DUF72 family [Salipaludibacillus aurantiacus]